MIDCIRRWWGGWITQGMSTTPEMWEWRAARGSISHCHAWSAHPLVHFAEILLGITQLEPAWRKIRFTPDLSPGERFTGAVPTPYGAIRVELDYSRGIPHETIHAPSQVVVERVSLKS